MDEFILIPQSILEDKELNHAQMILLWLILKLANKTEKKCYTSYEELGDILNLRNRAIRGNLKALVERGYIEIGWQKIANGGKKLPTTNSNWKLEKQTKFIAFGKKLPPYIYNILYQYDTRDKKRGFTVSFWPCLALLYWPPATLFRIF